MSNPENFPLEKMEEINNSKDLWEYLQDLKSQISKEADNLYDNKQKMEAAEYYEYISKAYNFAMKKVLNEFREQAEDLLPSLEDNATYWEKYSNEIKSELDNSLWEYFSRAKKLKRSRKYSEAIKLFEDALKLADNSEKPSIYNEIGNIYFDQFDYEQAKNTYNEALQIDPKYYIALGNLALCYHRQGKIDKAIELYKKTLEIYPKHVSANINLGIAFYDLQQDDEAKKYFDYAYDLAPEDFDSVLHKAMGEVAVGNYLDAIPYFKIAIKKNEYSIQGQLGLAEVYFVTENYEECLRQLEVIKKMSFNATYGFIVKLIENCFEYMNNWEQAHENTLDILNLELVKSLDNSLWDTEDIKKFVNNSNKFDKNAKNAILTLIEVFEGEEDFNAASLRLDELKTDASRIRSFLRRGKNTNVDKPEFKITNTSIPDANQSGYYLWELYFDEPNEKLEKINYVTYILHPTFSEPVIDIKNKKEKFKLTRRGWGSFQVKIKIHHKDFGKPLVQYYWLDVTPTNLEV